MIGLGKSEEKGKEEKMEQIPEEFVDLIARRVFDKYGNELANFINKKVSQQLESVFTKMEQVESEIQHLKTAGNEKVRDFLRVVEEIKAESVAEMSAKKAIESVGIDIRLNSLNNSIEKIKEVQMEFVEKLEKLTDVLEATERILINFEKVSTVSENIEKEVDKSLDQFNKKVENAVNKAVESIRENVVVDKTLIESVISQSLSRLVSAKFTDIEAKVAGMSNRIDALSKSVSDLKTLYAALEDIINRIEKLRETVETIGTITKQEIPEKEEEPLKDKAEKVKREQDSEELKLVEGEGYE